MKGATASTSWLMVLVFVCGLLLGFGPPAVEVYRSKELHAHGYIAMGPDGARACLDEKVAAPFWPRYRLRLQGKPWRRVPVCLAGKARPGEVCRIENPEYFMTGCVGPTVLFLQPLEMRRTIRRLNGLKPDPRLEALVSPAR